MKLNPQQKAPLFYTLVKVIKIKVIKLVSEYVIHCLFSLR